LILQAQKAGQELAGDAKGNVSIEGPMKGETVTDSSLLFKMNSCNLVHFTTSFDNLLILLFPRLSFSRFWKEDQQSKKEETDSYYQGSDLLWS
jgi:hypothetical protein